jgi:uncharacterized protein YndB with AHSA1/START domain
MTERSVTHATFVIERTFPVPPAKVFAAFADPALKRQWFAGPPEWGEAEQTMEFRVGGRETSRGGPPEGPIHAFDARFQDIIPDRRIIFSYDMHLDDTRISVSLATVDLKPAGKGTHMTFTEQGAFLDGWDDVADRERGSIMLMDALGAFLKRQGEAA